MALVSIAGLGYGMGNPVASKGLFLWFSQKTRGTAFGLRQAAVTIGGAAAGMLMVYLCQKFGPFVSLQIIALMIIFMMIFACFFYRHPASLMMNEIKLLPDDGLLTVKEK